jgi:hypothetical protein
MTGPRAPWLRVQPDPGLTFLAGVLVGGLAMVLIGVVVIAAMTAALAVGG